MAQETYQEIAEIERAERRNQRYLGAAWTGIISGFAATVIGFGTAIAYQSNPAKSDLIKEYLVAQQTINTMRDIRIDNPQYLDGIISGVEFGASKILRENGEEIEAHKKEGERRQDISEISNIVGLSGVGFVLICAGLGQYIIRRSLVLALIRGRLERANIISHPVEAYTV